MNKKVLKRDYTVDFMHYGKITVPKGTKVTHKTAMGLDESYHFVDEFEWIDKYYSAYSNILKHDVSYNGINVPKEFIQEIGD